MKGNVFTTKLYDIILPTAASENVQTNKSDTRNNSPRVERSRFISPNSSSKRSNPASFLISPRNCKTNGFKLFQNSADSLNFDHIFLIMDFVQSDMKKVLLTVPNGT